MWGNLFCDLLYIIPLLTYQQICRWLTGLSCPKEILHTFVYYSNRSAQTVSEWALDVNPKH